MNRYDLNVIRVLLLSSLLIVFSSLLFSQNKKDTSYREYELKLTKIIGEKYYDDEKAAIFKIASVDTDSKGNIYILDAGRNQILKYDKDGNFIKSWGNKGLGPGEFILQSGFVNDQIVVNRNDTLFTFANNSVQVFDTEGNYKSSFKYFKQISVDVDKLGRILQRRKISDSLDNPIEIIKDGDSVKNFGEFPVNKDLYQLKIPAALVAVNYEMLLKIINESLYVVYQSYPVIQKYSMNGKLEWEKNIEYDKISFLDDNDIDFFNKRKNTRSKIYRDISDFPQRIAITQLSVDSFHNDLFILTMKGQYFFLQLDTNGYLKAAYKIDPIIIAGLDEVQSGLISFKINTANKKMLIFKSTDSVIYEAEICH